jgi:hypothetical protein
MKIEVNLSKRFILKFLILIVIFAGVLLVYAYNSAVYPNPPNISYNNSYKSASQAELFGHTSDEVNIRLKNGIVMTLQDAIDSGIIPTSSSVSYEQSPIYNSILDFTNLSTVGCSVYNGAYNDCPGGLLDPLPPRIICTTCTPASSGIGLKLDTDTLNFFCKKKGYDYTIHSTEAHTSTPDTMTWYHTSSNRWHSSGWSYDYISSVQCERIVIN